MGKFESKNTILTKKLNDVIYELMIKTHADMVYTDDVTTLTETLSNIGDILTSHTNSFDDMIDDLNSVVKGTDEVRNRLEEVWNYVNVYGDPKSELIKMIEAKQEAEEGKGLSTCDFTTILKEKLENGYSKEELDHKFSIIMDSINGDNTELTERVANLESKTNISLAANDADLVNFVDGDIWFKIISKDD